MRLRIGNYIILMAISAAICAQSAMAQTTPPAPAPQNLPRLTLQEAEGDRDSEIIRRFRQRKMRSITRINRSSRTVPRITRA